MRGAANSSHFYCQSLPRVTRDSLSGIRRSLCRVSNPESASDRKGLADPQLLCSHPEPYYDDQSRSEKTRSPCLAQYLLVFAELTNRRSQNKNH
ncbi:MAG: hypothetical protein MHMPM18_002949 [Marteilia pararefringens]